jgi:exopolysaccharide biosynthesis polyprenyl glycosylphosphotransferase
MSTDAATNFTLGSQPSPARVFCERKAFLDSLYRERKRCERAGTSLLLALLYLDGIKRQEPSNIEETIITCLCTIVRDTDIPGWYNEGTAAGVIFTALPGQSGSSERARIHSRLMQALAAVLPAETLAQLRITYHFYPECDRSPEEPIDPVFYPDLSKPADNGGHKVLKRGMDIAGSLLAILLASPLFLVIAALIKLTSEGPIVFKQARVGQGGKLFVFFKFRSMYVNNDHSIHKDYVTRMIAGQKVAHDDGTATGTYKLVNDPRITRIGAFLRRSSLDELPQLFNVLRGEMSLIGPRPPLPYEVERYSLWHRRRVVDVKPGITGLWQVSGRNRTTFDEMVRLDLHYIVHWSLWMDIKILLKSPLAIFSGSGAC